MNTHARTLLAASALLGISALVLPIAASAEYAPTTACTASPPVQPVLISPFAGAAHVPLEGNWIEIASVLDGAPPLDQQRIVLTDNTPYAIDGGTLQLDPGFPWQNLMPQLATGPMSSMRVVKAWVPALRADTQYSVHVVLPSQTSCVFATLGSFTTADGD
jgi:hypothetical protein